MSQVLNHYIDCLSKGQPLFQKCIRFYVTNVSYTRSVEVVLPASGSLLPLFNAFGLISAEELNTFQPYTGAGNMAALLTAMHPMLLPGFAS